MAKVAKRLFFDVTGLGRVNALPGATFDPGGITREPVIADNKVVGPSETLAAPTMQFRVANTKGMLAALRALDVVNVNVQDDNGDSWIVKGAFNTSVPSLSNGEITCNMAGESADPI